MLKDVSKTTIAVLLIVAIILSVTSTLMAVAREPTVKMAKPVEGAEIRVNVVAPDEPAEPVVDGSEIKVNVVD